jgi:ribokinase
VTLGSRGCIVFSDGKRALIPPLDLSSFGLKAVNTVGAGDTFVGTFASFRLEGLDFIESLFLANIAAGLKTTREETRGSPSKLEILKYAGDSKSNSALNSIRLG